MQYHQLVPFAKLVDYNALLVKRPTYSNAITRVQNFTLHEHISVQVQAGYGCMPPVVISKVFFSIYVFIVLFHYWYVLYFSLCFCGVYIHISPHLLGASPQTPPGLYPWTPLGTSIPRPFLVP